MWVCLVLCGCRCADCVVCCVVVRRRRGWTRPPSSSYEATAKPVVDRLRGISVWSFTSALCLSNVALITVVMAGLMFPFIILARVSVILIGEGSAVDCCTYVMVRRSVGLVGVSDVHHVGAGYRCSWRVGNPSGV